MPEIDIQFRAQPEDALQFMKNLARDDGFRSKVASNPVAALAAYNIHVVPAGDTGSAALDRGPDTPAARMDAFGEWVALCEERVQALERTGFKTQGFLPPKHIVEEAIVNIPEANEFAPPQQGFAGIDPFGFWLLCPLSST